MTAWRRWGGEDQGGGPELIWGTEGRGRRDSGESQNSKPCEDWTRCCGSCGATEASFGPPGTGCRSGDGVQAWEALVPQQVLPAPSGWLEGGG